MAQNKEKLEAGQYFRNKETTRLVRVERLVLEEARIFLDPADREVAPFEMDISDFLKAFRLA